MPKILLLLVFVAILFLSIRRCDHQPKKRVVRLSPMPAVVYSHGDTVGAISVPMESVEITFPSLDQPHKVTNSLPALTTDGALLEKPVDVDLDGFIVHPFSTDEKHETIIGEAQSIADAHNIVTGYNHAAETTSNSSGVSAVQAAGSSVVASHLSTCSILDETTLESVLISKTSLPSVVAIKHVTNTIPVTTSIFNAISMSGSMPDVEIKIDAIELASILSELAGAEQITFSLVNAVRSATFSKLFSEKPLTNGIGNSGYVRNKTSLTTNQNLTDSSVSRFFAPVSPREEGQVAVPSVCMEIRNGVATNTVDIPLWFFDSSVKKNPYLEKLRAELKKKIESGGVDRETKTAWDEYWNNVMASETAEETTRLRGWTPLLARTKSENIALWTEAMDSYGRKVRNDTPRTSGGTDGSKHRYIGEFVTPLNAEQEENQKNELLYFRSIGYDGVLVVWYGEEPSKLISMTRQLAEDGWIIMVAYGATGGVIYNDMTFLGEFATGTAPVSAGVVPLWREASPNDFVHYIKGDTNRTIQGAIEEATIFSGVVCELFSYANPSIKTYGVRYVSGRTLTMTDVSVANSYGTMVYNIGVGDAAPAAVSAGISNTINNCVLVVGPNAYYKSLRKRLDITDADARRICRFIEDKMLANKSVSSTVTIAGDGRFCDRLTESKWSLQD